MTAGAVRGQRSARSLVVDKLRAVLTDWLSVTDKELEQEYRAPQRQGEARRRQLHRRQLQAAGDRHRRRSRRAISTRTPADFKIPEKRKVRYLLVDIDALRAKVVVPPADIERAYNDNIEQYSTPEQVRASHILLKTEGKDDAAVKAKAEELLKQAQGGRRLRRAGPQAIRKTRRARRTAATSITSGAAAWCRNSIRSPSRWSRGR